MVLVGNACNATHSLYKARIVMAIGILVSHGRAFHCAAGGLFVS